MVTSKVRRTLLSTLCLCLAILANAYSPTYYTATSKLASGHWVKIKVSTTGIQEITNEQLLEMGFSNPSAVSVYGYGGVLLKNTFDVDLPDDLIAQPVLRTNDKILFYGESNVKATLNADINKASIQRNTYANAGYYFLSDRNPGESAAPNIISSNNTISENRSTHKSIRMFEEEKTCPAMGGARFFGNNILGKSTQTISFIAEKADTTVNGQFNYAWAAAANYQLTAKISTNGLTIVTQSNPAIPAALYSNSEYYYNSKNGYLTIQMKEPADSVYAFTLSIPASSSYEFAAIDYLTLTYSRKNDLSNCAQLPMIFNEVSSRTSFTITGADANTQVWNVTSPINIFAYRTSYDSNNGTIKSAFERKYSASNNGHAYLIAFNPEQKQHQVEYVGEVANQNIHSLSSPDMLIITNSSMMEYAQQLAETHRNLQGISVHVVDQEAVFNEFSSGTPSAMAYRRVAKMFYDRNSSRFKYLLLYGAGHYDNRGLIFNHGDKLLTYQCESANEMHDKSRVYCSDAYFGMLQDNYDPSRIHFTNIDIAVSRIPADRQDKAIAANNKTLQYLTNPPKTDATCRALLMADNGDLNSHMMQTQTNADSIIAMAPFMTITKAYKNLYPLADDGKDCKYIRPAIAKALTAGQFFMCYTGHGAPESFSNGELWSKTYVNSTNYDYLPIAFLATCDALSFDRADDGIAETMLFKNNGGVIAAVGASRTVYKDYNQLFSLAFSHNLFSKVTVGDCIGDLYRKARASATLHATNASYAKIGINNLCYNMIGDPALPLPIGQHSAVISTINDQTINSTDTIAVYPRALNVISGSINTSNGEIDTDFNGTVSLLLYNSPVDVSTYNHGSDEIITITRDEDLLAKTSANVVNGLYTARLNIPLPTYVGSHNRLVIYAVDNQNDKNARSYFNTIKVLNYDKDKAIDDNIAPEISQMYLNSPDFQNGDNVTHNATLHATILSDESGINMSSSIGAGLRLTIDDSHSYNITGATTADIDGTTTVAYNLKNMDDGYHTLTLSLADNAGNIATREISFYVINDGAKSALSVDESPARTQATINLSHNFNNEPSGRLIIEDALGNVVLSVDNCQFPYSWNLIDINNNPVADGIYNCYAILNSENMYSSTDKVKIIVIKQ